MKLRFRIIVVSFCLSFCLLLALTFYAMQQYIQYNRTTVQVDKINQSITQLRIIEGLLKDVTLFEKELPNHYDSSYKRVRIFLKKLNQTDSNIRNFERLSDGRTYPELTMLKSNLALRKSVLRQRVYNYDSNALNRYDSTASVLNTESNGYVNSLVESKYAELQQGFDKRDNLQNQASGSMLYLLAFLFIGTLILFLLMMYELTLRGRYQDQLHANLVNLKNAHMELEQVAFSMSHHLKEPIRKIRVFTDRLMIKTKGEDEEITDMAQRISNAAQNMQQRVKQLETLASLNDETHSPVDLEDVIARVIHRYRDVITKKEAQVHVADMPIIRGDKEQLSVLFTALVDNALKFTHPGTQPHISIENSIISGHKSSDIPADFNDLKFYHITIADDGIGFEQQYNNKVFDLFQRLHASEDVYPGKGTGLTIARRIMNNHHGFITARGEAGKGVTIHLYFPFARH